MQAWQVQDAKTRLSELIEKAQAEGPQAITRHGHARAVLLSIDDYRTLTGTHPDFKSWLLGGPKLDDFPVERTKDTGREIEF